jgi:hypothetical protein
MQALLPPPGAANAVSELRSTGDALSSLDEVLHALFRREIVECLVCGEPVEVGDDRAECRFCGTRIEPAPGLVEGQLELL